MSQLAPRAALAAMFLTAFAMLVLQISLTRLLSVMANYHSAFAVIGLVMLALAASASAVFIHSSRVDRPVTQLRIADVLLASGVGAIALIGVVFGVNAIRWGSLYGAVPIIIGAAYFGVFFGTGYAIAWMLGHWPKDASRLYWLDLTGAAIGCACVVPLLDLGPPSLAVAWCGVALTGAGLALHGSGWRSRSWTIPVVFLPAVGLLFAPNAVSLSHIKGNHEVDILWEKWNHLAQVTVSDGLMVSNQDMALLREHATEAETEQVLSIWPYGWGMGRTKPESLPNIHWIMLDAEAGTQIIENGGNDVGEPLSFLTHDVTATAYQLRSGWDKVFVIGGGGGRDFLTALHMGAKHVDVGELNPDVVRAVNERFGDYSGHPYSHPNVTLHLGDARSNLAKLPGPYDLIQMSMIDTWAASVSGAMVLTENSLYTRESFSLYLDRLGPDGVLTVSRWADGSTNAEIARTLALAGQALMDAGVEKPEDHVMLLTGGGEHMARVGTLLIKRSPITDEERLRIAMHVDRVGLDQMWPAEAGQTPLLDVPRLLRADAELATTMRLDLRPPTDDRPFFFELRPLVWSIWWGIADRSLAVVSGGVIITMSLLACYLIASVLMIVSPLERYNRALPPAERIHMHDHRGPVIYFAMIGFAFLFVEVAILQRYMTFLGHPTRALSVVLFSLLLSSGFGAGLSARIDDVRVPTAVLLLGVLLTAFGVPPLLAGAQGLALATRIVIAVALVLPLGLCMGMMFPLGVRRLEAAGLGKLVPWLWGVNGMAGVMASVLAIMIAMLQGYTAVILVGGFCYSVMLATTLVPWHKRP